jgi:hypothetical protein
MPTLRAFEKFLVAMYDRSMRVKMRVSFGLSSSFAKRSADVIPY